jgi:hypothetical protein
VCQAVVQAVCQAERGGTGVPGTAPGQRPWELRPKRRDDLRGSRGGVYWGLGTVDPRSLPAHAERRRSVRAAATVWVRCALDPVVSPLT